MNKMIKDALILFAITLVSGLGLGAVYNVTSQARAQQEQKTKNAAYQYFEEDIKGTIKENKLADLVILDKNPLKVDVDDIRNIKVVETFKEGNSIYKA